MRISLIIPVWNDAEGLKVLLTQAVKISAFTQIIVCDDNSVPPMRTKLPKFADHKSIIWDYSSVQKGAGHARNRGIELASEDYVLFFDSDDYFTDGFEKLIADLDKMGEPFDFCLFSHSDSRMRTQGAPGPLGHDQRRWDRVALSDSPSLLRPAAIREMVRLSAYPWNKLYRRSFLNEFNIRCTEIPVHNDIELHWASFFHAKCILGSTRMCCEHVIIPGDDHLTNRRGAERLEVFRALEALQKRLEKDPALMREFIVPMGEFCRDLCRWILETLDQRHHSAFNERAQRFLRGFLTKPLFTLIAYEHPNVAYDINQILQKRVL